MSLVAGPYPGGTLFPLGTLYPGVAVTQALMPRPGVTPTANELYSHLPQVAAYDQVELWPLLLLCDALVAGSLNQIIPMMRDTPDGPGWSSLVDMVRVPTTFLPWLAQFVGTRIADGLSRDQMISQILNWPNTTRGRPSSMLNAIQATLTGTRYCILRERRTDAYNGLVIVREAECPDPDATRAAIAASKPGMVIVNLQINSGPSYGDIKATLPPPKEYGDRETMYPTYGDILGV